MSEISAKSCHEVFVSSIVRELRAALGNGNHPLHAPQFIGKERQYLNDCISSTFVSSVGGYVDTFETELAKFVGVRRAVVVASGTSALQVALHLAGVKADDEVVVPTLSFVATANAVSHLGAIPHFVDSSFDDLGIDAYVLRDWLDFVSEPTTHGTRNCQTGRRIKAIIPMHVFGHPCDIEGLMRVAHDFKLEVVEDAAEALGSYYHGAHVGGFGLLGILSFNGNKIITTGGGGAILTNDERLANQAKHLSTTAKVPHQWEYVHDDIGYNYRMPNINAALGCAQLENLSNFIMSKRRLARHYQKHFDHVENVRLIQEPSGTKSNYWLQGLVLDRKVMAARDLVLKATNDEGLMTRPAWSLIHDLAPYKSCPKAPLPVATQLAKQIINIPSSAGLV